MLRYATFRSRTPIAVASALLILIALAFAFRDPVNSQDRSDGDIQIVENSLQVNDIIRTLPISANDVVYSQFDQKLYISSPSTAGSIGNTVSRIDPLSGQVLNSIFVGSEPNKLALSSDGQTLYVVLDGASAIRRIDLTTQTAGQQFPVGAVEIYGYYSVSDIAVAPDNPNKVAVARVRSGLSPPGSGVAIFNDGIPLPLTGPGHSAGANFLAFATASVLYGGGYESGLRTMTVSASGVVDSGTNTSFTVARVAHSNGLIYTSNGRVIEPQSRTLLGTFSNLGFTNAFAADVQAGRVLYAVIGSSPVTLRAYDTASYVLVGTLTLPGIISDPVSMVRYGGNGLALVTADSRLHLVQTSLIPTNDPLPTPSPTPTVPPSPVPTVFPAFVQQLDLVTKDLISNEITGRLLASVPSTAGVFGNSIATIEPLSARIESSSFVGSEPNKVALSDDGRILWVGLDGAYSICRFDINTNRPGSRFFLGTNASGGLAQAKDIEVVPGSTDSIAVTLSSFGVKLFDNGVPRGAWAPFSSLIEFTSPTELALAGDNAILRYAVTAGGLNQTENSIGSSGDFQAGDRGRLFYANGRVIDTIGGRFLGTFRLDGQSFAVAVDEIRRRAFFLVTSAGLTQIKAFNIDTYLPTGSIVIGSQNIQGSSLVRWGSHGLAWREDSGRVFIVRSTLVDGTAVLPTPTPTPTISPTPSISPTPPPTFVRSLEIPVADVVLHPLTAQLHVSVPSSAGPGTGNSIVRIDPVSGGILGAGFIGSEPGRLAMSNDGRTLYCKLDGAGDAIRRFDIETNTAGLQFIGPPSQSDMRVMPGNSQTVAIASTYFGSGRGVSVWDNGVRRGNSSGGSSFGTFTIDFVDASTIYSCESTRCFDITVTSSGPVESSAGLNWGAGNSGTITVADGLVYAPTGRVFSPFFNSVTGSFFQASGVLAVDKPANRIYFFSAGQLTAYDLHTFVKIGAVSLPLNGTPTRLIRWGENGLALLIRNGGSGSADGTLYLVRSSLVSSSEPVPTGVQLTSSTYTIFEGSIGTMGVTVSRTGDLSDTTQVSYSTVDGSAVSGADYLATSGTLEFAPGETIKTFNIQILNDNVFEASESFGVSLNQVSGGNAFIVSPRSAAITINNDDPRPGITGNNRRISEFASTVLIPVTLSNPSVESITVNYSTANGSAQAGTDYIAASGVLTFAPLETSKLVPVTLISDTIAEPDEVFSLLLASPVNASVNLNALVTIVDSPGFAVSGRVTTPAGQGLRNAVVTLIDSNGVRLTAATSSFGVYQFDAILNGQTVTLSVSSKRYRFAPRIMTVSGNLANVDFVGLE